MSINMVLELSTALYHTSYNSFLNNCAQATNKDPPDYTLAVFCDLLKAFNVINHKILHKLKTWYSWTC